MSFREKMIPHHLNMNLRKNGKEVGEKIEDNGRKK
jgi:hypothetical protein